MSQKALSAEIPAFRTCAACYKPETKYLRYQRCGACQRASYCSRECQKKDWRAHKQTCQIQSKNRESFPAKGTKQRNTLLSDIKKWYSKHTQLLVYAAMHSMKLHDPANLPMVKTHMLVVELEPAPSGNHGDFVDSYAGLHEFGEPKYGLTAPACAALVTSHVGLERDRHRLTMYVRSGAAVYVAPISVVLGT
ncbi:hypothetical protein B0H14DRAFT_2931359 [Mycena olivaceomarginata]|nr:hypothetical protein B0H14DRAFT_2931359 [Mycena olivaceomarginata]